MGSAQTIAGCFKPFQGFLPVSSMSTVKVCIDLLDGFKPFQGFLPVSSGLAKITTSYWHSVSNPSRASYRFLPGLYNKANWFAVGFKPFQGFLPVSSNLGDRNGLRPKSLFQTLPGLLTGFFFTGDKLEKDTGKSFKPFQGFLPVSSGEYEVYPEIQMLFQTLPGLLTGFFEKSKGYRCNK